MLIDFNLLSGYRLKHAPKIVSMTMTSRCNLRCVMCDHGIRKVDKEDFDPNLIDRIGDYIAQADIVDLTGLGEPLLSELFWKILDRFTWAGAPAGSSPFLMFNTNGLLLTPPNVERILNARACRIRVSVDSPDDEMFRQIRGAALADVIDGAKRLIAARNSTGRRTPLIGIEMTVMMRNLHQINAMVDLASEIGADFVEFWSINELPPHMTEQWVIKSNGSSFSYREELLSPMDSTKLEALVSSGIEYAKSKGLLATFVMLGKFTGDLSYPEVDVAWKEKSIRCDLPWKEMRATYKGDVFACCWGPKPIGNLRDSTMEQIWNSPAIRGMRRDLVAGKVPKLCDGAACQALAGRRETQKSA